MGTEIGFSYDKNHFKGKNITKLEELYCKESAKDVLEKLLPKYKISIFRNINTISTSKNKGGRFGPMKSHFFKGELIRLENLKENYFFSGLQYLDGLYIKDFNKKGLNISNSVNNFSTEYLKHPKEGFDKEALIRSLISEYLIDQKIKDPGRASSNTIKTTIHKKGKYMYTNYLEKRKTSKENNKENELEDILTFGQILFGNNFNIEDLNQFAKKEIKKMPKRFKPIPSEFYGGIKNDIIK